MKILLIGSEGSIGKLHQRNLKILNENNIDCVDSKLGTDLSSIECISIYDLVIICTPTNTHLDLLKACNNRGAKHIMLEKPLCSLPTPNQLAGKLGLPLFFDELKSQVFINHAYRFERGINKLKELVANGLVGKIDHVFMENWYLFEKMHQYPKDVFEGVIYDDSHMINTSRYLWGEPKEVKYKDISKFKASWDWITDQGIEVAHTTIETSSRYKKRIEVIGEKGNLIYNFKAHEIFFAPADESERIAISYKHSCHLFEALKYVLGIVKDKKEFDQNTIWDGVKDMEIIGELLK